MGEFTSLPLGSFIEYSSAISRSLQLSEERQSQCIQLPDSMAAASESGISRARPTSPEHSFNHSCSSFSSSFPMRDLNRLNCFSDFPVLKEGSKLSGIKPEYSCLLRCEIYICRFLIETGISTFLRLQAFSQYPLQSAHISSESSS